MRDTMTETPENAAPGLKGGIRDNYELREDAFKKPCNTCRHKEAPATIGPCKSCKWLVEEKSA